MSSSGASMFVCLALAVVWLFIVAVVAHRSDPGIENGHWQSDPAACVPGIIDLILG